MFTRVKLPYTKFLPFVETESYYSIGLHSAQPWLEEYGLENVCKNRDIKCVIGWIKPGHRIPIHLDNGPDGLVRWALDFTTEECKDVILEFYKNLNENNNKNRSLNPLTTKDYEIPVIELSNADFIGSYSFSQGAVLFDPGNNWHTGFNPSKDKWMGVVSLRSWYIEDGIAIKERLQELGMISDV